MHEEEIIGKRNQNRKKGKMGEGSKKDGMNASQQDQSLRSALLVYFLLGPLHFSFLLRFSLCSTPRGMLHLLLSYPLPG